MELLVGSVSGGNFPYQLISLILLTERGYKPEVCMGGSGGAISIYCGSAADWNPQGIKRVAGSLSHELFVQDWGTGLEKYVPSYVLSYFYGSVYRSSDKSGSLIETYFTSSSIKRTEIWSAAINQEDGRVALFCNRSADEATIKGDYLNRCLHSYEDVRYMDGDLKLITSSLLATSSIPIVIEPTKIDDKRYVDCGAKYGSPLCPMYEEVMNISRRRGVRIIYISGYNIQTDAGIVLPKKGTGNMGDHLRTIPCHIIRSMIEQDRSCAYSIVNDWCEKEPKFVHMRGNELSKALEISAKSSCSLVEIYPTSDENIDITCFTGGDLTDFIENHSGDVGIRLWHS